MTPTTDQKKTEETKVSPEEKQKRIDAHKQTATHLETAAKHHQDAAKHHEENNHEKAAKSTLAAQGHLILAKMRNKKKKQKNTLQRPGNSLVPHLTSKKHHI
jgi:hypothetical protein